MMAWADVVVRASSVEVLGAERRELDLSDEDRKEGQPRLEGWCSMNVTRQRHYAHRPTGLLRRARSALQKLGPDPKRIRWKTGQSLLGTALVAPRGFVATTSGTVGVTRARDPGGTMTTPITGLTDDDITTRWDTTAVAAQDEDATDADEDATDADEDATDADEDATDQDADGTDA